MNAVTETKPAETVSHKGIYSALAAAQAEMTAALKSSTNPHFGANYADLAAVKDACFPALNRNGIAIIQPTTDDEGGRYVETILHHGESDTAVKCRVPLIIQKNDMQGYGSAVTYARRYGLMSLAGIAPEDDDGNAAAAAAPKPPSKNPDTRKIYERLQSEIDKQGSLDDLRSLWGDREFQDGLKKLPEDWIGNLKERKDQARETLLALENSASTPFDEGEGASQ